jgi:hypothetical protein
VWERVDVGVYVRRKTRVQTCGVRCGVVCEEGGAKTAALWATDFFVYKLLKRKGEGLIDNNNSNSNKTTRTGRWVAVCQSKQTRNK